MNDSSISLYQPNDYESEKASNGYLMSVVAVMVGLPLPIINLAATGFFYLGNRRSTYYVRWHCTQALLSQIFIVAMNSVGLSWTLGIVFGDKILTNQYIAYILTIIIFNLAEFIMNIAAAIKTRKGKLVYLWLFGPLSDLLCRK
jgi:hypothetical protein